MNKKKIVKIISNYRNEIGRYLLGKKIPKSRRDNDIADKIIEEIENTKHLIKKDRNGLKDHEIQKLINSLRDKLSPYIKVQCLREMIASTVIKELENMDLRIDKV